jgi:hypothetical protein
LVSAGISTVKRELAAAKGKLAIADIDADDACSGSGSPASASLDDLWKHMQEFQAIADANPGPDGHPSRNSGEPG